MPGKPVVVVDLPPAAVPRVLAEAGHALWVSPVLHPSVRHALPARRRLGVPAVFNMLAPLTGPAAFGPA
ncbi:hypothetical protein [Microbispora maris]|uniref:hypothetical protein n=1 Tax=Microbispora maris TaxID=3144104 RepID=UPI003D15E241